MQIKIFTGDFPTKVEAAVNTWLSDQEPTPTIHLSETQFQLVTSLTGMKTPLVSVTVWYSQTGPAGDSDRRGSPASS